MAVRIQVRRGTAAQWVSANPVLSVGEPGFETDTGWQKVGDGSTAWVDLEYEVTRERVEAVERSQAAEPVEDDFTTRPDGAYDLAADDRPTWVGVGDAVGGNANVVVETRSGARGLWHSAAASNRQWFDPGFVPTEFSAVIAFAANGAGAGAGLFIASTDEELPIDVATRAQHAIIGPDKCRISFYYDGLTYSISNLSTTNGSKVVTAPSGTFDEDRDVGRILRGTGIAAADPSASGTVGSRIDSVESDTQATLSTNATATGTITASFDIDYAITAPIPTDLTPVTVTFRRIDHTKMAVLYDNVVKATITDDRIPEYWGRKVMIQHYQPTAAYQLVFQSVTAAPKSYVTDQIESAVTEARPTVAHYAPVGGASVVVPSTNVYTTIDGVYVDVTIPPSGELVLEPECFVNMGAGLLQWAVNPGRSLASIVTNITSGTEKVITGPAGSFIAGLDEGKVLSANANIPAGTTIASVQSDTQATMSANATAAATTTTTIGSLAEYGAASVANQAQNNLVRGRLFLSGWTPGTRERFQLRARSSVAATHYRDSSVNRRGSILAYAMA